MRCTICDKSDIHLSIFLPDQKSSNNFYVDPKDKKHKISVLCEECAESYIETMHEFHLSDLEEDT